MINEKTKELLNLIEKRLFEKGLKKGYNAKNQKLFNDEMKEIFHDIILKGLSNTDFFENNKFHGGTALKYFGVISRFSKDLDFNMLENKNMNWEKYEKLLNNYWKDCGLEFNKTDKYEKMGNFNKIELKENNLLNLMKENKVFPLYIAKNQAKKLEVELESYFRANTFKYENLKINRLGECEVSILNKNCLFSGKINAVLTRKKKGGERNDEARDYYDLVKCIECNIKPDYKYLKDKLLNSKYEGINNDTIVNKDWTIKELIKRINGLEEKKIEKMNGVIEDITKEEDCIIIGKDMLIDAVKKLDRDRNWGDGSNGINNGNSGNDGNKKQSKNDNNNIGIGKPQNNYGMPNGDSQTVIKNDYSKIYNVINNNDNIKAELHSVKDKEADNIKYFIVLKSHSSKEFYHLGKKPENNKEIIGVLLAIKEYKNNNIKNKQENININKNNKREYTR